MIPRTLEEMPEWFAEQIQKDIFAVGFSSWVLWGVPPDEAGEAPEIVYAVMLGMHNARIVRADPGGIPEQWCYPNLLAATQAFLEWPGLPPGPDGWIRNVSMNGIFRRDEQGIYRDGER